MGLFTKTKLGSNLTKTVTIKPVKLPIVNQVVWLVVKLKVET